MADTERKPAGEHGPFWENEAFWRGAAFAVPVIVGTGMLGGLVPTFFGPEEGLAERSEIYGRFALIGVAIVTFTTVMWRGMIATRQADSQERQLENFNKQFAKAGDDTLATLFQNGAEMLADDKPSRQSAGIATLHSVAEGENNRLAVAAMNLLADYVQDNGAHCHEELNVKSAIHALNTAAHLRKRVARRNLSFETIDTDDRTTKWTAVHGAQRVSYKGGFLLHQVVNPMRGENLVSIKECFVLECTEVLLNGDFMSGCEIRKSLVVLHSNNGLTRNTVQECEFSNCMFVDDFPDIENGAGNFYRASNPPWINHDGQMVFSPPPQWLRQVGDDYQDGTKDARELIAKIARENTYG